MSTPPAPASADPLLVRARVEVLSRLAARGVGVTGRERDEELVAVLDAVERFALVAEHSGADLMVDEPLPGAAAPLLPDDLAFVLPRRGAHESPAAYLARVAAATHALTSMHRRRAAHDA